MQHSEKLDQIAPAIVAFQREIKGVVRKSENTSFKSRYADLTAVWDTIREPLTNHGLFIVQLPGQPAAGVKISLSTMLGHTSGQYIKHEGGFPINGQDIHSAGSGITFLKRYAILAALGLPTPDDDGNGAADRSVAVPTLAGNQGEPLPDEVYRDEPYPGATEQEPVESAVAVLIPAIREEPWARYRITFGKNKGKLLGELDDDSISGSYKLFVEDVERWEAQHPEGATALRQWNAWKEKQAEKAKEHSAANPLTDEQQEKAQPGRKRGSKKAAPAAEPSPEPPASDTGKPPDGQPAAEPRDWRKMDFAAVKVSWGKNRGLRIDELSPTQVHWYETEGLVSCNKARNGALTDEDRAFFQALKDYAAWRKGEYSPALPLAQPEPVSVEDTSPRPPTPTATTPAALKVAPATTGEIKARQAELKGRKDLPRRPGGATSPATPSEPATAPKSSPPAEKPATVAATPQAGPDWRKYVLPVGKDNKGKALGELSMEVLLGVKKGYLDARQWDDTSTLKPFDVELKRMVELAIENDGKPPEVPLPALSGPLQELYNRIESVLVADPIKEFFPKMKALKKIPDTVMHFEDLHPAEAQAFLDDWAQTEIDWDADIAW